MRIHYFQHVPFEGIGSIEEWVFKHGYSVTYTKFFESQKYPEPDQIDCLIVMGGPMGIDDEKKYPWLKAEKQALRKFIESEKIVVGICLGAQLIADVLGAKVYPGAFQEIGWFPIELTSQAEKHPLFEEWPKRFPVFHWHGDTFDIPNQAVHLAKSEGCLNQAFLYHERILALQFHLEATEDSIRQIIENCKNEIDGSEYTQDLDDILSAKAKLYQANNKLIYDVLDRLCEGETHVRDR